MDFLFFLNPPATTAVLLAAKTAASRYRCIDRIGGGLQGI